MKKIIRIKNVIPNDLALRDMADSFFDQMEAMTEERIEIDFSDIRSISRSFAHQFIARKNKSCKTITMIDTPECVEKMFKVIDNDITNKSKILNLESMQVVTI